jgi:anti-sigma factor RsiW
MKHPSEESISALVDGMLTVAETQRVAAHLAQCAPCRESYDSFASLKSMLKGAPDPASPDELFWAKTFRRMRTEVEPEVREQSMRSPLLRRQIGSAVALATITLAVVLTPLTMKPHPSATSGPVVAQDTLDAEDVSSFVRMHTSSAAAQPLADRDRQQLISADVNTLMADDGTTETSGNGEPSL